MTFLHNNCEFEIYSLEYENNKSRFVQTWISIWKIKPLWLQDKTFNLTEVQEDTYKITIKNHIDININEKIKVISWNYLWEYSVKEVKKYEWIKLKTTKILITKINHD